MIQFTIGGGGGGYLILLNKLIYYTIISKLHAGLSGPQFTEGAEEWGLGCFKGYYTAVIKFTVSALETRDMDMVAIATGDRVMVVRVLLFQLDYITVAHGGVKSLERTIDLILSRA